MEIRTHQYAKAAYPLVAAVKDSNIKTQYRTLALNFPTMIMQSGLVQAIGFLQAKGKPEHQKMLQHMAHLLGYHNGEQANIERLKNEILQSNLTQYQLLTRKALNASGWLKRYTQALLTRESDDEQQGGE